MHLYCSALKLRRAHPALGDGTMRWFDTADDLLVFERDPGFVCAVNLRAEAVTIPAYGELLLSSSPMGGTVKPDGEGAGDGVVLPPDTAAWFSTQD